MKPRRFARLLVPLCACLAACADYVPPAPAPQQAFSRDLPGSYDRSWSAVTYVAGATFFKIKAFEKASGLMTLDFELKDVLPNVDCGTAVNKSTKQQSPALGALGLASYSLSGTANINIRAEGAKRTAIQFNGSYVLDGYRQGQLGLERAAEWKFTSGSSDVATVGIPVTCRSSYKIENDFLTEVAARL